MSKKRYLDPVINHDLLKILEDAREIISDPGSWIRGTNAAARLDVDRHGNAEFPRTISDGDATCFCSAGAIMRADYVQQHPGSVWGFTYVSTPAANDAFLLLEQEAQRRSPGFSSITAYNDSSTHEEVLELWDTVIAQVKMELGVG